MNCAELRENILELAAGPRSNAPAAQEHLRACAACAAEVAWLQKTMAVLDEWHAPADTSPYFMTRLRARLREEVARQAAPRGVLAWLRRPALVASMAVLLVAGASLLQSGLKLKNQQQAVNYIRVVGPPATAVGDLQYLEKNSDVLANFDLLDDMVSDQQEEVVNP